MLHKYASFATHSLSLKCAANGVFFSERNLCSCSRSSITLASKLARDNHLISVYKRRLLFSLSISSQSCSNRLELNVCALMWLIIKTSFITLFNSGGIFQLARISLWMIQRVDPHSGATSLMRAVNPDSRPVMAAVGRYADTTGPFQFSCYVIIQQFEQFCSCGLQ